MTFVIFGKAPRIPAQYIRRRLDMEQVLWQLVREQAEYIGYLESIP